MIDQFYAGGLGLVAASWWTTLAWPVLWTLIKIVVVLAPLMGCVAYLTLWERKAIAFTQLRQGPNRVGPKGLLTPIADALKLLTKEIIMPAAASKGLFLLGPIMTIMPALAAWAVIPFGPEVALANVNAGLLFLMAITSLEVYGVIIAGWASNSKYAFLGALRASAQMVSYEISMGMATVCVLLIAGNVSLTKIIDQQVFMGWNVLLLSVASFLFLVAAFAETNRVPFDLPEAESELIAGYHSEYSAMKFSMFPISEYANMITASGMFVTLFFGGWDIPFTTWDNFGPYTVGKFAATFAMFVAKVIFFVFFYIWIRWTLPRFRYDQLMSLGWKVMLPTALAYVVIVASAILGLDMAGVARGSWAFRLSMLGINVVLFVILFMILDRGRLVSPAASRLDRARLQHLRAQAPSRATLNPKEIR